MVYVDLDEYYKYTNNVVTYKKKPTKNDVPYVLEHVFDLDKKGYVTNNNQCCYYTPIDMNGMVFEVEDTHICSILDDFLTAKHTGSTNLNITLPSNKIFKIKINVYTGVFRGKITKDILFIEKDTSISLKYIMQHIHCKHYDNCIWQRRYFNKYNDLELFEVDYNINMIKNKIKDLKHIRESYRNGDIIYHPDLKEYYNINILKTSTIDGKVECKITYNISETFLDGIKDRIKESEIMLKEYNRFKYQLERRSS